MGLVIIHQRGLSDTNSSSIMIIIERGIIMKVRFKVQFTGGIETNNITVDGVLKFVSIKRESFAGGWDLFKIVPHVGRKEVGFFETLLDIQTYIEHT